jgi:putative transcriptional regulator
MKSQKNENMETDDGAYLNGQLLTAMPGLADDNFSRTVTCICKHSEEGAVGIVVNRQHPILKGEDIFKELEIDFTDSARSIPIHIGGPVNMWEVFVLHGPPFEWNGCVMINPTLAISNTKDILEAIAQNKEPRLFIIALGYAGWGNNQLEMEIKKNVWLTCPFSVDLVFKLPVESIWEETMKSMGIDPLLISDSAGRA